MKLPGTLMFDHPTLGEDANLCRSASSVEGSALASAHEHDTSLHQQGLRTYMFSFGVPISFGAPLGHITGPDVCTSTTTPFHLLSRPPLAASNI